MVLSQPVMFCKRHFIPYLRKGLFLTAITVLMSAGLKHRTDIYYGDPGYRGFDVVHYLINLTISDPGKKYISGHTDIQMVSQTDSLSGIRLDLLGMQVDSVWYNEVNVPGFSYNGIVLYVPLDELQAKGTPFMVSVFYQGSPQRDPLWGGFYFEKGTAFNMGVGMGSDPPVFGRAWFPCVDNFTDRATYEYFIRVSDEHTAVCSGVLRDIIEMPGPLRIFHWELDREIPTYLSSVAVGQYVMIDDTIRGMEGPIPFSIYVPPGDTQKAKQSFRTLPLMLEAFEHTLGPYRWPRIGFVSVPFPGGAMEHATNISISSATITGDLQYENLYAHELAHSWFGNLVTCATAGDMWLNEGWARYCEALFLEYRDGQEAYREYIKKNHYQVLRQAHIRDGEYLPVFGIPPDKTYGTTVYNKGADVIHTLRGYMGDRLFFRAIRDYLKKYAFGSVTTADFEKFLSVNTGINMDDFFNTWVYSPGFPHFSVDSFMVAREENNFRTRIYLKQKLKGREILSYGNQIEIRFMDRFWNIKDRELTISGESAQAEFLLPFHPNLVLLDPEAQVSGAYTSSDKTIRKPGTYSFDEEHLGLEIIQVPDSAFIHVTHHWVTPCGLVADQGKPADRYWTVQGLFPDGFRAHIELFADRYFVFGDENIGTGELSKIARRIKLFHRHDRSVGWKDIPFEIVAHIDRIVMKPISWYPGEYALTIK